MIVSVKMEFHCSSLISVFIQPWFSFTVGSSAGIWHCESPVEEHIAAALALSNTLTDTHSHTHLDQRLKAQIWEKSPLWQVIVSMETTVFLLYSF